ncbi:MAG: complex I subunit 4 family protein [Acidobacteriota bacterium]
MSLLLILLIPIAAGLLAWIAARWSNALPRWISLIATLAGLALVTAAWKGGAPELNRPWIADLGIHFHLAMDGLSFVLIALTMFLGAASVIASWTGIRTNIGFFHLNLMWILAGIAGVFLARDLFLFYFAWELMLIPMYFLIAIWGHERRIYASVKFFLFTQISGLFMLISILALYFAHHAQTGVYSFEYSDLLGTRLAEPAATWIMLGFFVAFAVKLPMFPLHTWLPDAHTEAPTAGSVILAGLMLKTGGYGLLRFVLPLFPDSARAFAPVAMALAVAGILYGSLMAFAQTDLKRLVAYTSVSHLGFVLLGVFAGNELAIRGAVVTMIAHGFSTGALFIIAGSLQDRIHTREMGHMGGLWSVAPYMSGATMFFLMASLGLPGLADFVGEFLVLAGTFQVSRPLAVVASIGVLMSTIYGLKMIQKAFHGPNRNELAFPDLVPREALILGIMMVALVWLGLYPKPVLDVGPAPWSAAGSLAGSGTIHDQH